MNTYKMKLEKILIMKLINQIQLIHMQVPSLEQKNIFHLKSFDKKDQDTHQIFGLLELLFTKCYLKDIALLLKSKVILLNKF